MRWVRMTAATLQQIPAAKMSHPHHSRQQPLPGEVSTKSVPGAKRHCQSGKKKRTALVQAIILWTYGQSHSMVLAINALWH